MYMKQAHSNKKCFVSTIPSFVGHIWLWYLYDTDVPWLFSLPYLQEDGMHDHPINTTSILFSFSCQERGVMAQKAGLFKRN